MNFDEGPARAAPAGFPYPDHGTLADVWRAEKASEMRRYHNAVADLVGEPEPFPAPTPPPAAPPPRKIPTVSRDERLAILSAERAFERFTRGDW
jgi:hypothetical protein